MTGIPPDEVKTSLLSLADNIRNLAALLGETDQRIVASVIGHTITCLHDVAEEGDTADPAKISEITAVGRRLVQLLEDTVMASPPGSRH